MSKKLYMVCYEFPGDHRIAAEIYGAYFCADDAPPVPLSRFSWTRDTSGKLLGWLGLESRWDRRKVIKFLKSSDTLRLVSTGTLYNRDAVKWGL